MAKINHAEYLSIAACADEAGVTTQAVRKWVSDGLLVAVTFGQHATLVERAAWDRFLRDRERKADARAARNAKPKRGASK